MPSLIPSRIVLRHSNTQGAKPSESDLLPGEVYLNIPDNKLYYKNNDEVNPIIEINLSPSTNLIHVRDIRLSVDGDIYAVYSDGSESSSLGNITGPSGRGLAIDGVVDYVDQLPDSSAIANVLNKNGTLFIVRLGDDDETPFYPVGPRIYSYSTSGGGTWTVLTGATVAASGLNGTNGNTIISGTAAAPLIGEGQNGDYYLDKINYVLFGPKSAGVWPSTGVDLKGPVGDIGPQGPQGPAGIQGPAGPNDITNTTATNFTNGNVLFANSGFVSSLSRSGIDTRTSFPNADVTAATSAGTANTLVRRSANGGASFSDGVYVGTTGIGATGTAIYGNGVTFTGSFKSVLLDAPSGNHTNSLPSSGGTLALASQIPTLGTNVATFLAMPTSANLAAAVTGETGTNKLVFSDAPELNSPTLNTPTLNGITQPSIADIVRQRASENRIACVHFEDFFGTNSLTGLDDNNFSVPEANYPLAFGVIRMNAPDTLNARAGGKIHLQVPNAVGIEYAYGFSLPSINDIEFYAGSGYGTTYIGIAYISGENSNRFVLRSTSPVAPFLIELGTHTVQAGSYNSGTRYQVYIRYNSATQVSVKIQLAAHNVTTWTTIYDSVVTIPSGTVPTFERCSPLIGLRNLTSTAKQVNCDWMSVYHSGILR